MTSLKPNKQHDFLSVTDGAKHTAPHTCDTRNGISKNISSHNCRESYDDDNQLWAVLNNIKPPSAVLNALLPVAISKDIHTLFVGDPGTAKSQMLG